MDYGCAETETPVGRTAYPDAGSDSSSTAENERKYRCNTVVVISLPRAYPRCASSSPFSPGADREKCRGTQVSGFCGATTCGAGFLSVGSQLKAENRHRLRHGVQTTVISEVGQNSATLEEPT